MAGDLSVARLRKLRGKASLKWENHTSLKNTSTWMFFGFKITGQVIKEYLLTLAWLRGGRKTPPPPLTFLDRSKTAADIDAKLSVPFPASIWRLPPKFQRNPLRNFWVNGVLVTSRFSDVIFSDFGSKSSKCLQASWMCTFEVKHNP